MLEVYPAQAPPPMRWPFDHLNKYSGLTGLSILFLGTGNWVTIARLVLLWPIYVLLADQDDVSGAAVFIFAVYGDALDGSVARQRLRDGFNDDPEKIGEYLDPLIDKIFWIVCWIFARIHKTMDFWTNFAGTALMLIESLLFVVRIANIRGYGNGKSVIQAPQIGRIKAALEFIGIGFILYPQVVETWFPVWTGTAILFIAIPCGMASLAFKLWRR